MTIFLGRNNPFILKLHQKLVLIVVSFVNSLFIKSYRVSLRVLEKNNDRFYVGENDKSDLTIHLFKKEQYIYSGSNC